jgi:hypothetical protein
MQENIFRNARHPYFLKCLSRVKQHSNPMDMHVLLSQSETLQSFLSFQGFEPAAATWVGTHRSDHGSPAASRQNFVFTAWVGPREVAKSNASHLLHARVVEVRPHG